MENNLNHCVCSYVGEGSQYCTYPNCERAAKERFQPSTPPAQTVEEGKEGEARLRWVLLRDYLPNEDEEIVVRRVGMKNSYCVVVRVGIKLRDSNDDILYAYTTDPDIEWLYEPTPVNPSL